MSINNVEGGDIECIATLLSSSLKKLIKDENLAIDTNCIFIKNAKNVNKMKTICKKINGEYIKRLSNNGYFIEFQNTIFRIIRYVETYENKPIVYFTIFIEIETSIL